MIILPRFFCQQYNSVERNGFGRDLSVILWTTQNCVTVHFRVLVTRKGQDLQTFIRKFLLSMRKTVCPVIHTIFEYGVILQVFE